MKPLISLILALIIICLLIVFLNNQPSYYKIQANGNDLFCEIASTQPQQSKGLKYRESLYQNHGMLFVYKNSKPRTFIMTDCKFPIAIIFCDSEGRVVYMDEMKVNMPNEDKHYQCEKNAMYVIEANKNWFKKQGIKVGDKIIGLPYKENNL